MRRKSLVFLENQNMSVDNFSIQLYSEVLLRANISKVTAHEKIQRLYQCRPLCIRYS
jgi:hypothetical protein